ncbi:MAG: NUDIX domain-containing protein [Desulfamplus sp.]|nr:NUDIX domain-containing protein [Desulfamplus sp.]
MEKVLCIKRKNIPPEWLKEQSAIKMEEKTFFSLIGVTEFNAVDFNISEFNAVGFNITDSKTTGCNYNWVERPIAEKDSSFKQIIPYIIIQADNGKLTAIYRRKGSESRLHGLWSIGIGGHINPLDSQTCEHKTDFKKILYSGMTREFNEEIIVSPKRPFIKEFIFTPHFLGIINEDLTDVGKVHFGVVFKIDVDFKDDLIAREELVDFQWVKTEELLINNFNDGKLSTNSLTDFNLELWSQLAVQIF